MNRLQKIFWLIVFLAVGFSLYMLETERNSVAQKTLATSAGEVTLTQSATGQAGPLVVITHGFAGSRQMMQYIARDLARTGFTVASFDFFGHGRNATRMSSDVARLEGTTQQLIDQTKTVINALRQKLDVPQGMALVGHSMATDIIVRAAQDLPDVKAIVAISMYSDAVTAEFPERLLVVSGAWEERLRAVALEAVQQVDPRAAESETVQNGDAVRRAVFAPHTEHVAVLFSPVTLSETRAWLTQAFEMEDAGKQRPMGRHIAFVLLGATALIWPLCRIISMPHRAIERLPLRWFFAVLFAPVLPAILGVFLFAGPLFGTASFRGLLAFFLIWGVVALAFLWRQGCRPSMPHGPAGILLAFWALGVFAFALDRYAAAFVPVGPRIGLMVGLMLGTLPFMIADRVLVAGATFWQRGLARTVPVIALVAAILAVPQGMGLVFTVLPVLVLFFVVYGSMARAMTRASNPVTTGIVLGVVLAWSIAASTPLFLP